MSLALVVLPFTRSWGYMNILLHPGEKMHQLHCTVRTCCARDQVKLRAAGAHQRMRTAHVEQEPLLQQVGGVVGQKRAALNELNLPVNLKLGMCRSYTPAGQLGFNS